MFVRAFFAATLIAASAHAADFDRTLTTGSAPDLYIGNGSGHIHIYPGTDGQVHIKAHVYANQHAGDNVDERIAKIAANPPIRQSGNEIHVGDVDQDQRRMYNNITVDYEVSAPRNVALNLHSGSGDLEVDNLSRFLKADTGSGSVRAHGIAGPADLETGSGDIELQQTAAGEVKARTGSGSIRVNGLSGGPLTVRTGSGDIEANGSLNGPAHLTSGSGSVRVHIGRDAHFTINATTGSGSIRVPGSYNSDAHHLSAPINGGGTQITVETGSGDIEVN